MEKYEKTLRLLLDMANSRYPFSVSTLLEKHHIGTWTGQALRQLKLLKRNENGKCKWDAPYPDIDIAKAVSDKATEIGRKLKPKHTEVDQTKTPLTAEISQSDSLSIQFYTSEVLITELKRRGYRIQKQVIDYITV